LKLFDVAPDSALVSQVRGFADAGGQILFGTDVGFISDYDPSREYELLDAAGLSGAEILASLTTEPARRFGESDQRGTIAVGMAADLVLLGSNPLLNWRAFVDVHLTIREGQVIYIAEP
jgi:imidazolonepropionase-like amidohydrolase